MAMAAAMAAALGHINMSTRGTGNQTTNAAPAFFLISNV